MAIEQERITRRRAVAARLDLGSGQILRRLPLAVFVVGLVLGAASLVRYDRSGYSHGMLWLWLAGLVLLGVFFGARSRALPRFVRLDLAIPPTLALLFAPLYLALLYRWPVQVSSDEVVVMQASKDYGSAVNPDLFGLSTYLARPALLYIVWGKLGHLLGAIDLYHMRLLEASFGLLGIAASFALFRQLLPRGWAICASCLLGFSHSYLMISRLAMRENTAVLVEVIAFALLLWGLRNGHELATFLGGVVAGLGFYVYYPSRATFPLWVLFLIALAVFYRHRFRLGDVLRLGGIAAIGFVLTAGPIHLAEQNARAGETQPQRETLMIYSAGRELQKNWVFAKSQWDGYLTNVKYGLATFNNEVVDHGWIYQNPGHGFVDPLTGVLLWLGVAVVGMQLIRRRAGPASLLLLGSFLVLWLSFAFLVNKAPNYTRLLITLPFVAYLVTEALRWLAGRWSSVRYGSAVVAVGVVAAVAAWNLSIDWDFIQAGRQKGDFIGSTGRYVTAHSAVPGIRFYMATNDNEPTKYYDWGNAQAGQDRIRIFAANGGQLGETLDPTQISKFNAPPPFALFMRRTVWSDAAQNLAVKYPHGRLRNITPDGSRVVLEVPAS
jgi:hypothetical protein